MSTNSGMNDLVACDSLEPRNVIVNTWTGAVFKKWLNWRSVTSGGPSRSSSSVQVDVTSKPDVHSNELRCLRIEMWMDINSEWKPDERNG